MELKRVNEITKKNYAKINEISKNEIKKYTPMKWIVASSAGLVTLMYTNVRNSIHRIGVVIGCVSEPLIREYPVYQKFFYLFFDFASWILGVSFIFFFLQHVIRRKKLDEETRLKSIKRIKVFGISFVIFIIITFALSTFWKISFNPFVRAVAPRDLWMINSMKVC